MSSVFDPSSPLPNVDDAFIFEPPPLLVCSITHSLYLDPVVNEVGQMYDRPAIAETLARFPDDPKDPLTGVSLKGRTRLSPVAAVKGEVLEYREKAASACVVKASQCECDDAVRYLRRAGELLDGVDLTIQGLSQECMDYLRGTLNLGEREDIILQLFAEGLKKSGSQSQAANIYWRLLRTQQIHWLNQCAACLAPDVNDLKIENIKLLASIVKEGLLWPDQIDNKLRGAGMNENLVQELSKELVACSQEQQSMQDLQVKQLQKEKHELMATARVLEQENNSMRNTLEKANEDKRELEKAVSSLKMHVQQLQKVISDMDKNEAPESRVISRSLESSPLGAIDTTTVCANVKVLDDKVTMELVDSSSASVLGTHGVLTRHKPFYGHCYYYEVKLLERKEFGDVFVGFAAKGHDLNFMPGDLPNSYGYWGYCGRKRSHGGEVHWEKYGESFRNVGDVVGVGIQLEKQHIFFTKNGKLQGIAFHNVPMHPELFPAIGIRAKHTMVEINFGQKSFMFELKQMDRPWFNSVKFFMKTKK